MNIVALIPARSGSKRIRDKNIRILSGHPLIAYTISAALNSEVFSSVIVSTDSEKYANIAQYYGAKVPFLRSASISGEFSPDIEWVESVLLNLKKKGQSYDCFSILRPTSPFRKTETIQRAWHEFISEEGIDSLRAVERCKQHPGKMWIVSSKRMMPLLPFSPTEQPWHSSQYQSLPEVYVQNASLEIAWTRCVFNGRTIAGNVVLPFFTQNCEGYDVNSEEDWLLAEKLIEKNKVKLPKLNKDPY